MTTAREVALHVVRDVFPARPSTERTAAESLDYHLRGAHLDARDAAFATALAYGAIKMRRTVDWYLRPYLAERAKPLPPAIAEILRLAIDEIVFTAAPPHATVSEWVDLAKRYGHRGTANLVNAVLRGFLRDRPAAPERADFVDEDEYLGVAYSYPTWLVRQWRIVFGSDKLEAILEACNAPAQTAVVANRAAIARDALAQRFVERGARALPSELASDAVLVSDAMLAHALEGEAQGAWWVQSESSAIVVDVLNPQPGETIVDACSGRGNKALQIAARMEGEGRLYCIERDARKIKALEERALRAGLSLAPILGDATRPVLPSRCDRLLIDAPCSGTGVIGRHPEARWRKRHDDGERLACVQRALLESLAPHVFEGGVIVYAVCSVDPRETIDVVDCFVRTHNAQRGLVPASLAAFETDAGDVLIPPGLCGRDGFFIARLERGL